MNNAVDRIEKIIKEKIDEYNKLLILIIALASDYKLQNLIDKCILTLNEYVSIYNSDYGYVNISYDNIYITVDNNDTIDEYYRIDDVYFSRNEEDEK